MPGPRSALRPIYLMALLPMAATILGCPNEAPAPSPGAGTDLILATTTSTYDSGLLDELLPPFEAEWGGTLKVMAVGTGQALELGRRGDADVLMVHAPSLEKAFVQEGYGVERVGLMYNDFVIVGPEADPANVADAAGATEALRRIAEAEATFVSRGDNSGTHAKEKTIWEALAREPEGEWYLSSVLRMASEKDGYTLSDRSTYLAQDGLELKVLCEGDPILHNPYAVIAVDPGKNPNANTAGAQALIEYLLSARGQGIIESYGTERFGQPLFYLLDEE